MIGRLARIVLLTASDVALDAHAERGVVNVFVKEWILQGATHILNGHPTRTYISTLARVLLVERVLLLVVLVVLLVRGVLWAELRRVPLTVDTRAIPTSPSNISSQGIVMQSS